MIYKLNKKGETLIEVITALTSLVLAGVAAVTVIISMMQSNAISKEYLIAQNLAREGIEGVITIRNTNWLRFPSTKSTDWLCVSANSNPVSCTETVARTNHYRLNYKNNEFILENEASTPIAPETGNAFQLNLTSTSLYTHESGENSGFYRMITFEQIDGSPDKYKVTATVQWMNRSKVNEYKLSSIITNYAK
ncbi:MAG TPA: hypothetical protein PK398_01290 [Candidatus Gracilibacteria bacterium]|nr:hypothetical protein [Candidatus Gracilibacteria bacterium]